MSQPQSDGPGPRRSRSASRRTLLLLGAGLVLLLTAGVALAQHSFAAGGADAAASGDALKWTFRIFAAMTLIGACATIVMRNPVIAALCLVGTLFCTGGIYLLLHSTFLAAIQVLVYAGAIMVLFIFVVMSVGHTEDEQIVSRGSAVSKFVGVGGVVLFIFVISPLFRGPSVPQPTLVPSSFGDVHMIGRLLFSDYLFPFEALSILLLVGIVGAVMISRRRSQQLVSDQRGRAAPIDAEG